MSRVAITLFSMIGGVILRNRSASTGTVVFTLAFLLIAGNAFYSQEVSHPSPFWNTRGVQFTSSHIDQSSYLPTKSVMTHSISLKNIPVPTANPARDRLPLANSSLVRDVQAELAFIGLYEGKIDGIFGSGTQSAIIEFQTNSDILPNGEASYALLTKLKSTTAALKRHTNQIVQQETRQLQQQPQMFVFDTNLVSKIQNGLKENFGEDQIVVDGLIGSKTKEAIRNFQHRFKLKATGEPDEATIAKLLELGILESI